MNSLVGYGVSSGSDSDGDVDVNTGGGGGGSSAVTRGGDDAAPSRKPRNFLLESGSASSESGSDAEPQGGDAPPPPLPPHHHHHHHHPARLPPAAKLLPPPPLSAASDSSVFANPFKAQAERRLSALQKHVPLTAHARPSHIGGKRMCVSYRRDGRCRFGIKCKFAHDSDLQTTDSAPSVSQEAPAPVESHAPPQQDGGGEGEGEGGPQGKKRRVGLSNTLIPPKRAMKQYAMLRDRERLNMS